MADFLPTRSVLKVCLPVCLLNSSEVEQLRKSKEIDRCLSREKTYVKRLVKILLLGAGESGKSTFLKQMRIIHGEDFDQQAREEFRATIYSNVIKGNDAPAGRCLPRVGPRLWRRQKRVGKFAHLCGRAGTHVNRVHLPRHTHTAPRWPPRFSLLHGSHGKAFARWPPAGSAAQQLREGCRLWRPPGS